MFCSICLENKNIFDVDVDNKNFKALLEDFRFCVPEVVWDVSFKLCVQCKNDLKKSNSFKKLCIDSYKFWKNDKKVAGNDPKNIPGNIIIYTAPVKELEEIKNTIIAIKNSSGEQTDDCHSIESLNHSTTCGTTEHCGKSCTTKHILKKQIKKCQNSCGGDARKETRPMIPNEILDVVKTNSPITVELKTNHICTLCGTILTNKYLLRRHIQNVHATEKQFKCEICERSFTSAVYLSAHKRYHTGDRSHICSSCGKGFITASDLYHHEKIHANKRAYRCETCPKAFNTSSDLHKHKICVHLDRSMWKYSCTLCERKFPLKVNLDSHMKAHRGEKNYSCHICNKKCITKSVLQNHIQTHTNIMTLICDLCSYTYKYKKSLNHHMAKVHGIGK